MKCYQKDYWDTKRKAVHSNLREGEKVLIKQEKQNKLTTPFEPKLYEIIKKSGNQVTVQDDDDKVYKRNVTEVKKFNEEETKLCDENKEEKDETQLY